jgi:adenylate kinase family enzyme
MKRIRVVGSSGSGKSSFAKELSRKLTLPYLELDSIYHQADWTPCDPIEFKKQVDTFTNSAGWIVDGNYSSVSDLISQKADTFIFLDYPVPLVLFRLIRRSLRRLITKEILWNDNRETWGNFFSWRRDKNVTLWMLSKHWSRRRLYLSREFASAFPQMKIVALNSPREAARFLSVVRAE